MATIKKKRKAAPTPVVVKKPKLASAAKTKVRKTIPITVVADTRPIISCPEMEDHPQQFRFRGQCPVTTCQYCTMETASGCMSIDRKESSDRSISNKEIAYYKRSIFPELKEMDQKQLDTTIRRAQTRTRTAICLNVYIGSIDDDGVDRSFTYTVGRSRIVDQVHNYLSQTFSDYRVWMLAYLDDEKRFADAVGSLTSTDFNLGTALRLTPRKYQSFCAALKELKQFGEIHE